MDSAALDRQYPVCVGAQGEGSTTEIRETVEGADDSEGQIAW